MKTNPIKSPYPQRNYKNNNNYYSPSYDNNQIANNYEQNNNFDEILETYFKLQSIKSDDKDCLINLQEYKFSHDDETKMIKYIFQLFLLQMLCILLKLLFMIKNNSYRRY